MLPPTAEISTSHPSRLKTVFSERYFRRLRPKKKKECSDANAQLSTPYLVHFRISVGSRVRTTATLTQT